MDKRNRRNKILILLSIILLAFFTIGKINKISQLESELNSLQQDYNTVIKQYEITQNNLLEKGLYEDYADKPSYRDITIDLFESYSAMNENVSIPAYGSISNLSVLRNNELNVFNIVSKDENMTLISTEVYVPNWIVEIKKNDVEIENKMIYVTNECALLMNPHENSAQNTLLMYSTPVKQLLTYKDWVYVESLVKRDINILYKGWVKKENLGVIEHSNSMINRFCFIEKGNDILRKNLKTTAPLSQWGRIIEEDDTYYTVSTLGSNIYKIKKEAVVFLDSIQ